MCFTAEVLFSTRYQPFVAFSSFTANNHRKIYHRLQPIAFIAENKCYRLGRFLWEQNLGTKVLNFSIS